MCDPPCLSPSPDCLAWPLRIAVLGKRLSGKSTQIDFIAQNHKVKVIRLQILIEEAITACRENETITVRTLVPPSRMSTVRSKMTSASSRQSPAQTTSRPPSTPGSKSDNRSEETKSSLSERSKISTPEPEYLESILPSPRAQLGKRAMEELSSGQSLSDAVVVDLLEESLRKISNYLITLSNFELCRANSVIYSESQEIYYFEIFHSRIDREFGWLIDGFPMTLEQARLMAKTRIDLQSVVLLDQLDETSIKRATSCPDISTANLQQDLAQFHDDWAEIEKYYGEKTVKISAEGDEVKVYNLIEQEIFELLQSRIQTPESTLSRKSEGQSETSTQGSKVSLSEKKSSKASIRSSRKSLAKLASQRSLTSEENLNRCRIKKFVSKLELDEVGMLGLKDAAVQIMDVDSTVQGVIEDRAITVDFSKGSGGTIKFENLVLANLRKERSIALEHLDHVCQTLREFLRRPDPRQEFLQVWQNEFNYLATISELRNDNELKCELHQRFGDLRDRLWDISDSRKTEAEKERECLMHDGWLKHRVNQIIQHFLNLAQMELFRASKVCLTLRQFYLCQAEVFGPSPAHEGALFEITQTVPEVTVDVSISSSTSTG